MFRQICADVWLAGPLVSHITDAESAPYREEALDARALNIRRQLKRRKERVVTVVCHAVSSLGQRRKHDADPGPAGLPEAHHMCAAQPCILESSSCRSNSS